jgi:mono/diheme cytochrome c family protein
VLFHRVCIEKPSVDKPNMRLKHAALVACTMLACLSTAVLAAGTSAAANSKSAAQKGKATYLRLCQYCHGFDGKAHENIDFQATNLTDLSGWKNGTEPQNIFNSIKNGAGDDMPAFKSKASDEEIWQLVAYILSIGPEERRPKSE